MTSLHYFNKHDKLEKFEHILALDDVSRDEYW